MPGREALYERAEPEQKSERGENADGDRCRDEALLAAATAVRTKSVSRRGRAERRRPSVRARP